MTSTTAVPQPLQVHVDQATSYAIPLATVGAAIVAAIFLTLNEALKRREDRRQWDK
jgi:hypothetical protein